MKPMWLIVIASLLCAPLASVSQATASEPCPDTLDTKGRYVNSSYGFSILVPPSLNGVWNSARCVSSDEGCVCMSDHGRIIPLSTDGADSDHWVEVYAGFATALDEPTLRNAVASRLDWVRERSRNAISVLQRSTLTVGGLKARRVVVRYVDKETNRVMVEDFVVALRGRPQVEVEYSIYLRSPVAKYKRDKAIFEQVLKSFALTACDNC